MDPHTKASGPDAISHLVQHAAHLLPAQGPIGVFIHHNTLHAFQDLPFETAVLKASEIYGTEPFMSEAAYQRALQSGRIRLEDLTAVLASESDVEVWPGLTRAELRRTLMASDWKEFRPETVEWEVDHSDLFATAARRELLQICLSLIPEPPEQSRRPLRPRDGILAATGVDIDDTIHSWLIRLSSGFLDQGLAYWPMPNREAGFLAACLTLFEQPLALFPKLFSTLRQRCRTLAANGKPADEVILAAFEILGVPEDEWSLLIEAELLALRGWAGMMSRLELEPELAPHEHVPARLIDFLAVRMLMTVAAADQSLEHPRDWRNVAMPSVGSPAEQRLAEAATLLAAAIQLGFQGDRRTAELRFAALQQELRLFDGLERRRLFHLAYERRHERQILLPMREHRQLAPLPQPSRLTAQVIFCIDEREESIRRHLEEVAPEVETVGAAGFFGVAMNYLGVDDAHGAALCPVVVKPEHAVMERPAEGHHETYQKRVRLRRAWAWIMRHWSISSRTMVRGWLGTTLLGGFSVLPMAARVLSPRHYANLVKWMNSAVLPEPRTELAFERGPESHERIEGLLQGFSIQEKADRVASVLGPAGMRKGLARIVVVLGHGSTSLNNPHESAHDCGACGGRRGGPNGRIFAAMANHPRVREALRERGILIPDDTWFVGGYHDTCNDDVEYYDVEDVPHSHRGDLDRVREAIDQARTRSAHERARRFEAARWPATFRRGLQHVQERAEHLAEPRPEYGHCTNAVCVVGRRSTTRGLFFDRRAFLVSYDPIQDTTGDNLGRLLGAAVPVCAGISLEYYFSFVDNEGYGCGTKLPHNVTGLHGVMNGFESDLRTGLPWQMVEIHEPVRILFVIESTPEHIEKTFRASPLLMQFLENRWIRLAAQLPDSGEVLVYRDGSWEELSGSDEGLPTATSSAQWYSGRREHLPIARIQSKKELAVSR